MCCSCRVLHTTVYIIYDNTLFLIITYEPLKYSDAGACFFFYIISSVLLLCFLIKSNKKRQTHVFLMNNCSKGRWKCNLSAFLRDYDWPTNRQTNRQTNGFKWSVLNKTNIVLKEGSHEEKFNNGCRHQYIMY